MSVALPPEFAKWKHRNRPFSQCFVYLDATLYYPFGILSTLLCRFIHVDNVDPTLTSQK